MKLLLLVLSALCALALASESGIPATPNYVATGECEVSCIAIHKSVFYALHRMIKSATTCIPLIKNILMMEKSK